MKVIFTEKFQRYMQISPSKICETPVFPAHFILELKCGTKSRYTIIYYCFCMVSWCRNPHLLKRKKLILVAPRVARLKKQNVVYTSRSKSETSDRKVVVLFLLQIRLEIEKYTESVTGITFQLNIPYFTLFILKI